MDRLPATEPVEAQIAWAWFQCDNYLNPPSSKQSPFLSTKITRVNHLLHIVDTSHFNPRLTTDRSLPAVLGAAIWHEVKQRGWEWVKTQGERTRAESFSCIGRTLLCIPFKTIVYMPYSILLTENNSPHIRRRGSKVACNRWRYQYASIHIIMHPDVAIGRSNHRFFRYLRWLTCVFVGEKIPKVVKA